ncbi:MAG: CinA family nicotinamide mononucleotide deamidase-related protein [Thermodesulfobacteriota bacterium]
MGKEIIAHVLATGDELMSGSLADTNSAHIARELLGTGIRPSRFISVGDDLEALTAAILETAANADVAVVTGGLGPTEDDMTSRAAARAAGVSLALDPEALAWIEKLFSMMGRPMGESNRRQAYLPQGAERLDNPYGTAPGFAMTISGCRMFFVPGVPREMKNMLAEQVLPRLRKLFRGLAGAYGKKVISTFGQPEAWVGEQTADIPGLVPGIRVGLRAHFPVIDLVFYANADDESGVASALSRATELARQRFPDIIYSEKGDSLAHSALSLLKEQGCTLAIAESCTGGLISHMITQVPGSSESFLLSCVTYHNEAKQKVLGVSIETLARFGAVSEECAREMAEGVKRISGASYGLSTSGIAGPSGGSPEKPVGTVCIAISGPNGTFGRKLAFNFGDRERNKIIFACAALELLRRSLLGMPLYLARENRI